VNVLKRLLVPALFGLCPAGVMAQYTPPDASRDSALWWPLLDGITARELREEHQRERVVERYRASVAAGTSPDCGPEYAPAMFRDSEANPQLVPFWHQLYRELVQPSVTIRDGEVTVSLPARELRDSGLSDAGVDELSASAGEIMQEIARRRAERDESLAPAREILLDFEKRNPPPDPAAAAAIASRARAGRVDTGEAERIQSIRVFDRAIDGLGDPDVVARRLGGDPEDWKRWLPLMSRKLDAETMEHYLPQLRETLSFTDWRTLRRYLAARVGSHRTAQYSLLECPSAYGFEGPRGSRR